MFYGIYVKLDCQNSFYYFTVYHKPLSNNNIFYYLLCFYIVQDYLQVVGVPIEII